MNENTTLLPAVADDPHDGEDVKDLVRRVIDGDDARPSLRNEHLYTALAGAGFALCALLAPTRTKAACHAMLSGMLLLRAASGRDGLRKWAGAAPQRPERQLLIQG